MVLYRIALLGQRPLAGVQFRTHNLTYQKRTFDTARVTPTLLANLRVQVVGSDAEPNAVSVLGSVFEPGTPNTGHHARRGVRGPGQTPN